MSRRLNSVEHKSNFTDKDDEVNPAKRIFKKDKGIIDTLKTGNFPNAILDILIGYSSRWANGEEVVVPKDVKDMIGDVASSNDHTQKFIDDNLEITWDSDDRILEKDMMARWELVNSNMRRSYQQLNTDLKEKIRHPTDIDWKHFRTDLKMLGSKKPTKDRLFIGMKFIGIKNKIEEHILLNRRLVDYEEEIQALKRIQELETPTPPKKKIISRIVSQHQTPKGLMCQPPLQSGVKRIVEPVAEAEPVAEPVAEPEPEPEPEPVIEPKPFAPRTKKIVRPRIRQFTENLGKSNEKKVDMSNTIDILG